MPIERLDKCGWHAYFDALSQVLQGKEAQIDVNALDVGCQFAPGFTPLLAIAYDPRIDILEVLIDALDYSISNVRDIFVDHEGMTVHSVHVIDGDGVQQVIRLRDPMLLAAPLPQEVASHR